MPEETLRRRARSFGQAAAEYDRGRPGYPAAALQWVLPERPGLVLDLAAGTGLLARGLLAAGVPVVAVEPLAEMRRLVPTAAHPLGGVAEALPLRDRSVDAVLVGQAFHWFGRERALAEMVRVLRPDGRVGLFWNMMDDSVPWVSSMCDVFDAEDRASMLPPEPVTDGSPFDGAEAFVDVVERRFTHVQPMEADTLVANVASRSVVLLRPEPDRSNVLRRVRACAPGPTFDLPYVCQAWRAVRAH